jgi:hypothetical protein
MQEIRKVKDKTGSYILYIPQEEEKDLRLFFIYSFLFLAFLFFLIAGFTYLFTNTSLTDRFVILKEGSYRLRAYGTLFLALIIIPLYRSYALEGFAKIRLALFLFIFPVMMGFLLSIVNKMTKQDYFSPPFLSTGISYTLAAIAGAFSDKLFYVKVIDYLKLVFGFLSVLLLQDYLSHNYIYWMIAILIFWIYDFIALDTYKLIHFHRNPKREFDLTQQLFMTGISALMLIPIPIKTVSIHDTDRKWIAPGDQ